MKIWKIYWIWSKGKDTGETTSINQLETSSIKDDILFEEIRNNCQ